MSNISQDKDRRALMPIPGELVIADNGIDWAICLINPITVANVTGSYMGHVARIVVRKDSNWELCLSESYHGPRKTLLSSAEFSEPLLYPLDLIKLIGHELILLHGQRLWLTGPGVAGRECMTYVVDDR